ncbi:MAG: hypothetical protein HC914_10335 [Chloroflexaceae bacterium]|nr:hypothetical protein [Chloroflexaceae bacterium]
MTSTVPHSQQRKPDKSLAELFQFECSTRWLAAGIGTGGLALLTMHWGGWPVTVALGALGLAGLGYATLIEPGSPVLERLTLRLPNCRLRWRGYGSGN